MIEIRETAIFRRWLDKLKDREAQRRIAIRVRRLAEGNPGDVKSLGNSVSELRIDYGPGYRVYFTRRSGVLILLLAGGDKKTQDRDIKAAVVLADRDFED